MDNGILEECHRSGCSYGELCNISHRDVEMIWWGICEMWSVMDVTTKLMEGQLDASWSVIHCTRDQMAQMQTTRNSNLLCIRNVSLWEFVFWTDLSPGEFRSRNTVVTRCAHIVPFRVFCCPWRLVDDCILHNKIFMSLSLLTVTSNTWSQFRRNIILNPFCTSSNQSDSLIFLTCRGIYWRKTQMKRRTSSCKSVVLHNHHWQINRSLSINYCVCTQL